MRIRGADQSARGRPWLAGPHQRGVEAVRDYVLVPRGGLRGHLLKRCLVATTRVSERGLQLAQFLICHGAEKRAQAARGAYLKPVNRPTL